MKVYLGQVKCRNGHCLLTAAGEFPSADDATQSLDRALHHQIALIVQAHPEATSCGVCGSGVVHIEVRPTPFPDIDAALPSLRAAALLDRARWTGGRWLGNGQPFIARDKPV